MSKALDLMKKISEIGYYGQHNDYSTKPYDQDAAAIMSPMADLQLPDKSGSLPATTNQQINTDRRKSRLEDGVMSTNN